MSFWRRDEGSVTVAGCWAVGVVVVITAALLHVGSAVSARHRAQSAADLAALAAAGSVEEGIDAACDAAVTLAARMHTTVDSCEVDGWDVIVTVSVPVALSEWGVRDATAAARAGPSE
ncbi:MAG: flp pilus-assembly TadE/G-like family protein [Rhodococcus sp.]|nr:flp pilus-assembly TadE/G-like family protein [Rhodococcus sp. (in: high G+C Gram-positive bacteria)]